MYFQHFWYQMINNIALYFQVLTIKIEYLMNFQLQNNLHIFVILTFFKSRLTFIVMILYYSIGFNFMHRHMYICLIIIFFYDQSNKTTMINILKCITIQIMTV